MSFTGFYKETFEFLFEITFNNNVEWFNENRKRYERFVRDPLRLLASELMEDALKVDPNFNPNLNTSVSRIRRDTRFTYDKSPFRNHAWIGFRYPKTRISESCMIYFEITPEGYSYGFGLYSTSSEFMQAYRKRVLSEPHGFLKLARALDNKGYFLDAERYKRDRFPDAPEELKPYLNVKYFGWGKRFSGVADLIEPSDIEERLKAEMKVMKPMYEFIRSVQAAVCESENEL
ncbi:MAG: DUF2461 domain-containing protein [Clostridia bacterium]|nr:DUF2461 domain-containing protein [Clostridia bacterium]